MTHCVDFLRQHPDGGPLDSAATSSASTAVTRSASTRFTGTDAVVVRNDHPDYRAIKIKAMLGDARPALIFDSWRILDADTITALGIRDPPEAFRQHRRFSRQPLLFPAGPAGQPRLLLDDAESCAISEELRLLAVLADAGVKGLARRLADLSPESRRILEGILDHIRRIEVLDPENGSDT